MAAKTFADILKFNPYHDSKGRFASADAATSFTYAPGKSTAHDKAIQRAKDADAAASSKGFKGTLYHGSPATDIEEFDMSRAGSNTSSGEKLLYFTDSKQMAEDFSYERLEGSTKYFQRRGKKGRVYEVDVEMKNPLDFRNLSEKDIDNILKLDIEGVLTREDVKSLLGNHQLLKTNLDLRAESLKKLGYDGLIANTGKAGHNSLEYAVVDSKQATIRKGVLMKAMTFDEILKFNPYHDAKGRFSTADAASLVTIRTRDPGKQHLADRVIAREKEREAAEAAAGKEETPQMKVVHEIEDKIRNQDYESAACVDKDGNVLLFKDGEQSQVAFTREENALMKDNVLTHNHPSSSIFSKEDVDYWLGNDLQEIRATNRLGITYSLSRGENFEKATAENFAVAFRINQGKSLSTAQKTLDDMGYQWKIAKGEVTVEQANAEFRKILTAEMTEFCTNVAPHFGIKFSVEKRDLTKSAGTFMYTAKTAGNGKIASTLDKDTEAEIAAAFNEWLDKAKKNPTGKSDTIDTPDVTQTTKSVEGNETNCALIKMDPDQRLVFGWASISFTADGEQLEDLQHDLINPEDLEEAVYEYVLHFRDTGEEHRPHLRKKGKLVESCVFTAEKQRAMGLPEGILPVGWWIGFKIEDDEAWEKVKNGTYRMFSIEGKAQRVPVEKAAPAEITPTVTKADPERFDCIQEFDFP